MIVRIRNSWCYNFSKQKLANNMQTMIDFYNQEVERYKIACEGLLKDNFPKIDDFISFCATKISWGGNLKFDFEKSKNHAFDEASLGSSLYRPFSKQCIYYNRNFNERVYQMPRIFPDSSVKNRVICLTVTGTKDFSVIISEYLPDLHLIGDAQCFPLKLYEPILDVEKANGEEPQADLFSFEQVEPMVDVTEQVTNHPCYSVKDGIADAGLANFQSAYPTETITKEDVFYYIYGLLHSEDYRSRYADNLSKELPRIPCVNKADDFWAFSKAGRDLAELHINYETVTPYPVTIDCGALDFDNLSNADFYVTQMKFIKKGEKSTVVYNHRITMTNIPVAAYDYVVNGKPALEWVMERQAVTTHKDSGIKNDANDWAIETVGNALYPLELFQRVITVSLETIAYSYDHEPPFLSS